MADLGDRYRWSQHRHAGWWQGTDRLKNRKLEKLPTRMRFQPSGSNFVNLAILARMISEDFVAFQVWEAL